MKLDDKGLVNILRNFINIDLNDIPESITIHEFAVRLAEIAARGILTPLASGNPAEDAVIPEITFGTAANRDNSISMSKKSFTLDEKKYSRPLTQATMRTRALS